MKNSQKPEYSLNDHGEFIITNYNSSKLFSSFFPGVAGKSGIPMWVFYVNRGQCICSMGIDGKHKPIMEFLPANWAYNLVSSQGFRTFIKLKNGFYEPFQDFYRDTELLKTQKMIIAPAQLTLEEVNETLGLKFTVKFFNVPGDKYAGLIRQLKIENLNDEPVELEVLDGLPLIIPYGIDNGQLKFIRRLVEAFVEVTNYQNSAPLFKGKVKPADRPDVVKIVKGNFYLGFEGNSKDPELVKPVVDPVKIFGNRGDYDYPQAYISSSREDLFNEQIFENRLPSAMGYFKAAIAPENSYIYNSVIGHIDSAEDLNEMIPIILQSDYIPKKEKENKKLIDSITQRNFINSSKKVLDQYARQNFLDNVLRGGLPSMIGSTSVHLYSRKHGDLERDYNDYRLSPTNYSQGNGNFRDVNQNRRSDLFFEPEVGSGNIEHFYELIQVDGYNPLVIKEKRFRIEDEKKAEKVLSDYIDSKDIKDILGYIKQSFTPGELLSFLKDQKIVLRKSDELFLGELLSICRKDHSTGYGEGYWTDHWTYNLDLIENYLAVYPEKLKDMLFGNNNYSFYDNPHIMQPRSERYVIWEGELMQLNAVVFDEEKEALIKSRTEYHNKVRTNFGKGEIYHTNLVNKMLSLIVNKMATLDPEGVGIEMEAGKPNWYDALNGLPGLIGSSISETLEVKRHILFMLSSFEKLHLEKNISLKIFTELKDFMGELAKLLNAKNSSFEYWDRSNQIKERFREITRLGISGDEVSITLDDIKDFFIACLKKLDEGVEKAWDKNSGVINTYFINKVVDHEELTVTKNGKVIKKRDEKGHICFKANKFKQIPLPLFLEGPVHYMRCHKNSVKSASLAENIRNSGLYDHALKMYKVNATLNDQPMEIGRARTFSPGWFENESVWLHMEYKYMLELIRNGLYKQFYSDFKDVFVPFFDPAVYGRSILENSSFIVSSANPDPSLHGNGFVARLSGATAEFIHILFLMTTGSNPFAINQKGELVFKLDPAIPAWLFTENTQEKEMIFNDHTENIKLLENTFSFMFLSNILITYINPLRKDTFGKDGVKPASYTMQYKNGAIESHIGELLTGKAAQDIRTGKVERIEVKLN